MIRSLQLTLGSSWTFSQMGKKLGDKVGSWSKKMLLVETLWGLPSLMSLLANGSLTS